MTHEEARQWLLDLRGVETPCERCGGTGRRAYGSTATWRGGYGGQQITGDVCDHCWGSGDKNQKWADLRRLTRELEFARRRSAASLEETDKLAGLLMEWMQTPFFAKEKDWATWVDEFKPRVMDALDSMGYFGDINDA